MAVATLFVADIATMKQGLRLSGLPANGDAEAILFNAIQEVNTNFRRRLGNTRVVEILAFTDVDNPLTDEGTLRAIAELTEIKWVRMILLRYLPMMHLDGSGGAVQSYHEEAPFRHTGPFGREREIKTLKSEIEENLQLLEGSETITNETKGHISLIGPNTTPPRPGESIFTYL